MMSCFMSTNYFKISRNKPYQANKSFFNYKMKLKDHPKKRANLELKKGDQGYTFKKIKNY